MNRLKIDERDDMSAVVVTDENDETVLIDVHCDSEKVQQLVDAFNHRHGFAPFVTYPEMREKLLGLCEEIDNAREVMVAVDAALVLANHVKQILLDEEFIINAYREQTSG